MLSGGISLIIALCGWFIVLLYFIFILLDYERFMRGMVGLIPQKYKGIVLKIATDIKESMNRYFRGQALVAFIVGILFCIGFLIIDMPMAVVLRAVYRRVEFSAIFAIDIVASHHFAVFRLFGRNGNRILADVCDGNGCLHCRSGYSRFVSCA